MQKNKQNHDFLYNIMNKLLLLLYIYLLNYIKIFINIIIYKLYNYIYLQILIFFLNCLINIYQKYLCFNKIKIYK